MTLPQRVDRERCGEWFRRNRRRTQQWFDLVKPEAYYEQPISLRNPVVFYEGHAAAFNVNTLVKRGLARAGADASLETLFERGIDPHESTSNSAPAPADRWPDRSTVRAFADETDALVHDAIYSDEATRADNEFLRDGLAIYTILEHEMTHHETLLYMYQWLPYDMKRCPEGYEPIAGGLPPRGATAVVPTGRASLGATPGAEPFGWDNEFPGRTTDVPAFEIDVYDVTNRDFLEFVEAGGYERPEFWTPENWQWRQRERLQHPIFWHAPRR